jgi:phosphoribosylformylglycinamidine cyclo-ligase
MSSYKEAGVDIDAGEELVRRIKPLVAATATAGSLGGIGGFGGFFRPDWRAWQDPVLVSSVDGVGTKLLVASALGVYDTVGQDLVNHCVNDILACGARPLFFLDYYACGRLEVEPATEVVRGFAQACRENGCALVGGETAEMPGLYRPGDFDLAGTIVGMVERARILDGGRVEAGDLALALPSTGLHTNGYSLARRVLLEEGPGFDHRLSDGRCLADALLAVHRSYLHPVAELLDAGDVDLRAISHVTGGGILGNTARVLPAGLGLELDRDAWEWPELFQLIQQLGRIDDDEMLRAFNCGVGVVLILPEASLEAAERRLRACGEQPFRLGRVVRSAS